MKKTGWLTGCVIALLLAGCNGNTVYSSSKSLPEDGWNKDSVLSYHYEIMEDGQYDILLYVRHTENYPYQNMWLFVDNDTIEFYLADQRGRWLGNGVGRLKEMPVLYGQNKTLQKGEYTLHIQQGMREDMLQGVSNIGVRIEKHQQE